MPAKSWGEDDQHHSWPIIWTSGQKVHLLRKLPREAENSGVWIKVWTLSPANINCRTPSIFFLSSTFSCYSPLQYQFIVILWILLLKPCLCLFVILLTSIHIYTTATMSDLQWCTTCDKAIQAYSVSYSHKKKRAMDKYSVMSTHFLILFFIEFTLLLRGMSSSRCHQSPSHAWLWLCRIQGFPLSSH